MSRTVQLELPDALLEPLQRISAAMRKPLEDVVVTALAASLPPLDGLSGAMVEELVRLETLDDAALWDVMLETVPVETQEELEDLLSANREAALGEAGRARLSELQSLADRVMLRKGRAAVLLRFRGHRLPTLEEMRGLDAAAE